MKFLSEFIRQMKWGYDLGGGFRLSSPTKDELCLWKDGKRFIVPVEILMGDINFMIYAGNFPRFYLAPDHEEVPLDIWNHGIDLAAAHFRKLGKTVVVNRDT